MYDQFGRKVDLYFIAKYETLKKKSGSNPWPVIEEAFKDFEKLRPTEYHSYVYYLDDIRKTRKDPKFASTYDRKTGSTLRYTVDIPFDVMKIIRAVYSADELPMDKEFFLEFAKKFPNYKIAQKL